MRPKLCAIALIAWSGCALAQTYSVIELGSFGGSSGGEAALAFGVNDAGQVVGYSFTTTGHSHAFLYSNSVMQDLGTLGGAIASAFGINASGQVTGSSTTAAGETHAFLYSNGVMQDLNMLGGPYSSGVAINSSGQVTGIMELTGSGGPNNAFLYSNGTAQSLGTFPGGSTSYGIGINDSGQVTGWSGTTSAFNHAFIYNNGAMFDIGTLGGQGSDGQGINILGQVVGYSDTGTAGVQHAYLYANGLMSDLGTLGGNYSDSTGINDAGQIVGVSLNAGGAQHAFLQYNGSMFDLNTLIDPNSPLRPYVVLSQATGISNAGFIAAIGTDSRYPGLYEAFLLTVESNAPTVTPVIIGSLAQSGWYVSQTTVSWIVPGFPAPMTSGCSAVAVPNTQGTTYTCTATNASGSASQSVLIKEDTVKPSVLVKKPSVNAVYALNQKVLSSYSCLDATSGMAVCKGTVANGANIYTSTVGTQTFTVIGTDNAGNRITKTVLYTVDPATATPVFSLKTGTYTGSQQVSVTDATAGAIIYYTTNGSTPTRSSRVYSSPITINSTSTLKARAIATNDAWSAVKTAIYTIQ